MEYQLLRYLCLDKLYTAMEDTVTTKMVKTNNNVVCVRHMFLLCCDQTHLTVNNSEQAR